MLEGVAEAKGIEAEFHRIFTLVLVANDEVLIPVVVRRTFPIHRLVMVLVVSHIVSTTLPLMCLVHLILLGRVDEWLHADSVTTVIFLQVVDVESYRVTFADITD